jgi:twitching motility protein PilT
MNFEQLLRFGVGQGARAIHLQAEASPQLRIGRLMRNVESPPVGAEELRVFIASIAPKAVVDDLDRPLPLGSQFSTSIGTGRFRCVTFTHKGGPGLVLRVIPPAIPTVEELQLPRGVRELALASRGLILVAGPSGSGKTTTLSAMVDAINSTAYHKIVTVEAPIEFVHKNKKAMVTQLELGVNASSFQHGFELAMRQDADVIVLSDLRDPEVVRMAMGAVDAGCKVLSTVTGTNSVQVLSRLLASIVPSEGEAAPSRLAAALEGIVAQQLAFTRDGKSRVAVELLRGGPIIFKAIQENRLKELTYLMESRQGGMQSLDQHLIELHQSGAISGTEAMRLANNPEIVGERLRTPRNTAPAAEPAPVGLVELEEEPAPDHRDDLVATAPPHVRRDDPVAVVPQSGYALAEGNSPPG